MPETTILLAPVGAGKTQLALEKLGDVLRQPLQPFPKVWILLAGRRQEDAFRQRLTAQDAGRRAYFNVEFFSFYTLYARLLNSLGQPQRELDENARKRLLRDLLRDLQAKGQLQVYGQIADKRGFVEVVAAFIYELKQNVIYPEDFKRAARTAKDHDLALIYDAYQETLQQHNLIDREGEGWLALEMVGKAPDIARDVNLLLVDGYDQFNPLQARLLALLSARAQETLITLPFVPGREDTVGRRFGRALAQLQDAFARQQHPFIMDTWDTLPGRDDDRHPALRHLIAQSFQPEPELQPAADGVVMIEAPDVPHEVAEVLRRIKALLLSGACLPDDVVIALRNWEQYAGHFAALSRRYGVPLALHQGEPLAENPAIIALLNLLDLSENDFRRRDLLDTLRSPYFAFDGWTAEQADWLEHISQSQTIIGGRAAWLTAVHQSALPIKREDDDEREAFTLAQTDADRLYTNLEAFFSLVTPPEEATAGAYVQWLQQLIGTDSTQDMNDDPDEADLAPSVHILPQIRAAQDETVVSRDLIAVDAVRRVLSSLFNTHTLFAALRRDTRLRWSEFLADFKAAVGSAASNEGANRAGKVLVTTVADARGLPHRHVFIPGLSEGIFPSPTPEDPLYLDTERQALAERGISLETKAEQAGDDGLFYELISLAHESLTLSRPAYQNGALWPESHLWRAVRTVFSDAQAIIERHRIRVGAVAGVAGAAAFDEVTLAIADDFTRPDTGQPAFGVYNWLLGHFPRLWEQVRVGRAVEMGRMSRQPHDRYSGRLRDAALIAQSAAALGANRVWSASQFNDYGMCGFRFFAKRLLKLEAIEEPEEGMNVRQLGTLNHAILEKTYQRLGDTPITPENLDAALTVFDAVADDLLANAPERFGFRVPALWEKEKHALTRRLRALIEADFSEKSPFWKKYGDTPRIPYRQESPFGGDHDVIELPVAEGLDPLRVRGFIDRMDRQGDGILIVDYKTGSTKIPTSEMESGRNFQMMLYLLAAEHILVEDTAPDAPNHLIGGTFWHIRSRELS
ncbi:MAG: PD-(D/E)XK nuclease family protein, partial [Anaerolineae bacterium]|nr:PD-(D/E)XK nuclease family protein [Anaerolineae bacterium]